MEYSIIDSQMTNPRKDEVIEIAQEHGYKYYAELLYDMHCNKRKRPSKIAEMFYDTDGNKLITQESIYHTLRKYGWLIKKKVLKTAKTPKNDQPLCGCCLRVPKHPSLHSLCMTCYKSHGHKTKGAQGGNSDPASEYSHSGILVSWGEA